MSIKLIFLILFLIIGIIFTVGYAILPIFNLNYSLYECIIYINKINIINKTSNENLLLKYDDLNINNTYKNILNYVYYGCIGTSCIIGAGIIFSYLRMKLISTILFLLAQTFMSLLVVFIVFLYYSASFVKNLIPIPQTSQNKNIGESQENNISYENGGLLLLLSSSAMIVNYTLYSFIG